MTGVEIVREATAEDRPRLLAIQATSLDFGVPDLLRVGISGPPLVLVSGATPVGYALAIEGTPTHLVELAVAPAHRGVGHGSALLTEVCNRGGECRLTVRSDNDGARRFYERHGFRVETRLPAYYGDDDGLLYVSQPDVDPADSAPESS